MVSHASSGTFTSNTAATSAASAPPRLTGTPSVNGRSETVPAPALIFAELEVSIDTLSAMTVSGALEVVKIVELEPGDAVQRQLLMVKVRADVATQEVS